MSRKKIIGYVCRLCALVNSDLGTPMELNDGVVVEIVELPCAGKVDVMLLLAAFEKGADAVFVIGCSEHECMNLKGSVRAEKRLAHAKAILEKIGIGGERLIMYHVSGSCGPRFANIAADMAELMAKLGESPLKRHKA